MEEEMAAVGRKEGEQGQDFSAVEGLLALQGGGVNIKSSDAKSPAVNSIFSTATATQYGTFITTTGLEFIKNDKGEFVLLTNNGNGQTNLGTQGEQQRQFVNVSTSIGTLEEFKSNSDWNIYRERLEQYFSANFIEADRQVSVLITAIGPGTYKALRDLCDPILPQNKTYDEICEILNRHYAPRVSVYKERKKFYNLQQANGETVSQWYARVKKGAVYCEYGAELEGQPRNKFVTGMREGKTLDRIFEESHRTTLREILEIALKREAALQVSTTMEHNRMRDQIRQQQVNFKKGGETTAKHSVRSSDQKREQTVKRTCNHCGGINHKYSTCIYKTYKCKNCNKIGHLIKVCKEPRSSSAHYIEENGCDINYDESVVANLYKVETSRSVSVPPIIVTVKVEGVSIPMEVDSGAGVSVIPKYIYISSISQNMLCKIVGEF